MPVISIVVTTFNRNDLLAQTINSILSQTFSDFELIIVDNYSNYDFFALISEFNDSRIRAFQNQNNGIIAVNRNFGMQIAKGDFIALCDDDDLWEPKKLELQYEILKSKRKYALVCTGVTFIGDTDTLRSQSVISSLAFKILEYNIVPVKYSLLLISFITNSSVLFRREILSEIGVLNENLEYRSVEDFDFWLRISLKFKIFYFKEKLVKYRFHNSQISSHNILNTKKKTDMVLKFNWGELDNVQKVLFKFVSRYKI